MKNKISKESATYKELKNLWDQFDPIGVYIKEDSDCPDDEYESYILPTFELLKQKADFNKLYNYIHFIVTTHMGMDQINDKYIIKFVYKLQKWYEKQ